MEPDHEKIKELARVITGAIPGDALENHIKEVTIALAATMVATCEAVGLNSEDGQLDVVRYARRMAGLVTVVDDKFD